MKLAGQPLYSVDFRASGSDWGRRAGVVLVLVLLLGIILGGVPAFADGPSTDRTNRQIEELLAEKSQRTPAQRKISSQLLDSARDAQLAEADGSRQPRGSFASGRQQAADPDSVAELELVTVDIRANVTAGVLARIRSLGGTVINSVPEYRAIRAHIPLAAVESLAALDAVQFIRPADEAVTRKDNTSEGDAAHGASLARTRHGVTGTGIGIGVISDGVSSLANRQASGDLPARVTVLPGQEGSGDEGTALLEIVHDIAPGAELYFATAYGGQAQFAANIESLCEAGADVIVDDIGYYEALHLARPVHEGDDAIPRSRQRTGAVQDPLEHGLEVEALVDALAGLGEPGQALPQRYIILRGDKAKHEEGTFETAEADTGSPAMTYTGTGVVHQAFLPVDEARTRATAAAAAMLGITRAAVEPVTPTIDRPFIFLVRDRTTDAELHAGRVSELGQPG